MRSGVSDIERARQAAAAVLGGREPDRVVPSPSGVVNRSYFVDAGQDRFVLRISVPGSLALLGVAEEFDVLRTVADAGIGPRPAAFDAASGTLLVERIPGALPWDAAGARRLAGIHRIASLLKRLHALSADIEPFTPERYAQAYIAALGGAEALSSADRTLAAELLTLARAYRERFDGRALCHNDLVADNVLDGGGGLHLVDFEYAALSSPILDLASMVVMNGYSADQAGVLVYKYHERGAVPFSPAEFAKVTRLVGLLGHFWARAEQARRADHGSFARFLDREAE